MGVRPYAVGDRVKVLSLGIKGTIFYLDSPCLYLDYYNPVQVKLDKPRDIHGQLMYRTNVKDIKRLKKKVADKPKPKKKKKKKQTFDDEVFSF